MIFQVVYCNCGLQKKKENVMRNDGIARSKGEKRVYSTTKVLVVISGDTQYSYRRSAGLRDNIDLIIILYSKFRFCANSFADVVKDETRHEIGLVVRLGKSSL